jgi:hypothetical protein
MRSNTMSRRPGWRTARIGLSAMGPPMATSPAVTGHDGPGLRTPDSPAGAADLPYACHKVWHARDVAANPGLDIRLVRAEPQPAKKATPGDPTRLPRVAWRYRRTSAESRRELSLIPGRVPIPMSARRRFHPKCEDAVSACTEPGFVPLIDHQGRAPTPRPRHDDLRAGER